MGYSLIMRKLAKSEYQHSMHIKRFATSLAVTIERALREDDWPAIEDKIKEDPDILKEKVLGQETLLRSAIMFKRVKIVSFLLQAGADPNLTYTMDYSLALAAGWPKDSKGLELVDVLVQAGAQLNVKSQFGNTPLMAAVSSGNHDTAQYLLSHGADVQEANNRRDTALHIALSSATEIDRQKIVKLLLENGAPILFPNVAGKTPLDLAQKSGDLVSLLEQYQERPIAANKVSGH